MQWQSQESAQKVARGLDLPGLGCKCSLRDSGGSGDQCGHALGLREYLQLQHAHCNAARMRQGGTDAAAKAGAGTRPRSRTHERNIWLKDAKQQCYAKCCHAAKAKGGVLTSAYTCDRDMLTALAVMRARQVAARTAKTLDGVKCISRTPEIEKVAGVQWTSCLR